MTVSRASRPTTSALVQPVTRSQARLKRTMRPCASRTQTSVWAVSTSAAPTSWSTDRSANLSASSSCPARRAPCDAPIGARLSSDRYELRSTLAEAPAPIVALTRPGEPVARPLPPGHRSPLYFYVPGLECPCLGGVDTPDHRDGPPARGPARCPVEPP